MELFYCNKCGMRISKDEMHAAEEIAERVYLCAECVPPKPSRSSAMLARVRQISEKVLPAAVRNVPLWRNTTFLVVAGLAMGISAGYAAMQFFRSPETVEPGLRAGRLRRAADAANETPAKPNRRTQDARAKLSRDLYDRIAQATDARELDAVRSDLDRKIRDRDSAAYRRVLKALDERAKSLEVSDKIDTIKVRAVRGEYKELIVELETLAGALRGIVSKKAIAQIESEIEAMKKEAAGYFQEEMDRAAKVAETDLDMAEKILRRAVEHGLPDEAKRAGERLVALDEMRKERVAARARSEDEAQALLEKIETMFSERKFEDAQKAISGLRDTYAKTEFARKNRNRIRSLANRAAASIAQAERDKELVAGAKPGIEILYRTDFEGGRGIWESGRIEKDVHGRSGAVLKATNPANNKWRTLDIGSHWKTPLCKIGPNTFITFDYYLDTPGEIEMYMRGRNGPGFGRMLRGPDKLQVGRWATVVYKLDEIISDNRKKNKTIREGMEIYNFHMHLNTPGTRHTLYLDNFTITRGGLPTKIQEQIDIELARRAEVTGDPKKDGYYLTPDMARELAKLDRGKLTPKSILVVGAGLATNSKFVGFTGKGGGLSPRDGYRILPRFTAAGSSLNCESMRKKLTRALEGKTRPEVVVIVPSARDFPGGAHRIDARQHYRAMMRTCKSFGVVPIVLTYPISAGKEIRKRALLGSANKVIRAEAKSEGVPYVDAYFLLNPPQDAQKMWRGPRIGKKGMAKLNGTVLKLYRIIEKRVLGREPPGRRTAGPGDGPKAAGGRSSRRKKLLKEDAEFAND